MDKKYTDQARKVLEHAQADGGLFNHGHLGTEHLLLGLTHDHESPAGQILAGLGVTRAEVFRHVERIIGRRHGAPAGFMPYTPHAKQVRKAVRAESVRLGHDHIGPEHLLLGLAEADKASAAAYILGALGVTPEQIRREVLTHLAGDRPTPVLDLHGLDLTQATPGGVIGREREIERVLRVLSRRSGNRPGVIGEPGVGKTSIVRGVAEAIAGGEVPASLRTARVIRLAWSRTAADDLARIAAETAARADLVLVLDDVTAEHHALLDGLLRDETRRFILTATPADHAALLGAGVRLDRDCEPVHVAEPGPEACAAILRAAVEPIERHHAVRFTDAAIGEAVTVAGRLARGRRLPLSALDLLDEAGAGVRLRASVGPELRRWEGRLAEVRRRIQEAIDAGETSRLTKLRHSEKGSLAVIENMRERWREEMDGVRDVDAEAVRAIHPAPPAPATARSRLPDPARSTAVLLGAGLYSDPAIPAIPAVAHNLTDLAAALGDPSHGGFDPARIHTFPDFGFEDMAEVAALADATEDTLLVYYAGHGFTDEDGSLHLGLRSTTAATRRFSALDYAQLRRAILGAGARNRLVLLDCCFSGRAIDTLTGDRTPMGQLDIAGTYILTATAATQLALAPAGERHTAFTGALLGVLRQGVADGGPLIRVADLHRELTAALRARARPLPRQRNTDSIGDLAIARNRRAG